MALFPNLLLYDSTVSLNERTRFSAVRSYVTNEESAVTAVSINPDLDNSGIYIDVFSSDQDLWYLDYEYATSGTKVIGVRIDNGSGPSSITGSISVVTDSSDYLFSTDAELIAEEPDILDWLPAWKNDYKYMHRRAQEKIMYWLDKNGYVDDFQNKFTKTDIADTEEVNEWSKYLVLMMLMESQSNQTDDIFHRKARKYEAMMIEARNRLVLRIDQNADGTVDIYESMSLKSGNIYRR